MTMVLKAPQSTTKSPEAGAHVSISGSTAADESSDIVATLDYEAVHTYVMRCADFQVNTSGRIIAL